MWATIQQYAFGSGCLLGASEAVICGHQQSWTLLSPGSMASGEPTPGCSSVAARKLAPRDTSFLLKFQPNTPPPPAYRVPVTMSAPVSACRRIMSGIYLGCAQSNTFVS